MSVKRIILLLVAVGVAGFLFFINYFNASDRTTFYMRDEFDSLNRENWYIGEWGTALPAEEKVMVKDGILTATISETDRGPFLLSRPIEIKANSLITIKRKVKLSYSNNQFTGGLSLIQSNQKNIEPPLVDNTWYKNFGQSIMLVEYNHSAANDNKRPGNNNTRILVPDWEEEDNYALTDPKFGEWFEETLTFDCGSGRLTYTNGGKLVVLKGYRPSDPMIRLFMHGYGFYTGHEMKIDWIEIKVTQPN